MRRILAVLLGGLVVSLLSCSFIWAQATAQDQWDREGIKVGAVLPGA